MTEQTVQNLVQQFMIRCSASRRWKNIWPLLVRRSETLSCVLRQQKHRGRAVKSAAGAAGVRQGTAPTALVDARLLGKLRTFSVALAERKSWRLTFTAYAGALSPDMKRLTERAVAADTDGEILNVQLSSAGRAMSTQLFFVLVMCCESSALRTLERAGDTDGSTGWTAVGEGPRTRHCRDSRVVALADPVSGNTRGSLNALVLLVEKYESST